MIDIDAINEKRLTPLFPELQKRVRAMIAECNTKLDPLLITQGLRTWDEQAALNAQGRQGVSEVNTLRAKVGWAPIGVIENHLTVTNAQAGMSFHNYGLAVDVVPITSVGQPDWTISHPDWQIIVQAASNAGLEHGDRGYRDYPHFQLIGKDNTPELMKSLYAPDLSACWAEVTKRLSLS